MSFLEVTNFSKGKMDVYEHALHPQCYWVGSVFAVGALGAPVVGLSLPCFFLECGFGGDLI